MIMKSERAKGELGGSEGKRRGGRQTFEKNNMSVANSFCDEAMKRRGSGEKICCA
jgi:hypothetical protein